MQYETRKVADLIPYVNNARTHSDEQITQLASSIKEFGFINPVIIDDHNGLIAGHGRLMAAKKLGLDEVPVLVESHLTEAQKKAYILADNKLALNAGWDADLLKVELSELKDLGFDNLDTIGFSEDEIKDILNTELEAVEDEGASEIPEEPKSQRGDIWILGEHRLMCGDSTSENDVKTLLQGEKVDMVFTDPPYGMNLDTDYSSMKNEQSFAKVKGLKSGKQYAQGIVDDFKPEMISTILSLNVKETFLWGADYYAELLPNKNDGSWIVWDKRSNGNNDIEQDLSFDKMYGSCFELCWSKNKHKREIARIKWASAFGTEKEFDHKRHHPTQKPTALVQWFLDRYSKENDKIVDLFGGSGSTLITCEQLKRKCYTMELDEHYCDVICQRYINFKKSDADVFLLRGGKKISYKEVFS